MIVQRVEANHQSNSTSGLGFPERRSINQMPVHVVSQSLSISRE
jgi:hypothetical protein